MLFHNNHDGTFTDVTDKAGVANERWGFGVASAITTMRLPDIMWPTMAKPAVPQQS